MTTQRFEVGALDGVIAREATLSAAIEIMREASRSGKHAGLYTYDTQAKHGRSALWVPAQPLKCISK
jgi:hypothetical protein